MEFGVELQNYNFIIKLENCSIKIIGGNWGKFRQSYNNHMHSYYELHYVSGGLGTLITDSNRMPLHKGSFYLLPPRTEHEQWSNPNNYLQEYYLAFELIDMKEQANFWEQLCSSEYYTDCHGKACYTKGKTELFQGERYILLPSYSPENKPNGYNSTITANATMDISAARDGMKMIIHLENELKYDGYKENIKKWKLLMNRLPEYKFDETGALCEWSMKEYNENNEHRHISHLYCAWPAYEAQSDEKLTKACNIAMKCYYTPIPVRLNSFRHYRLNGKRAR